MPIPKTGPAFDFLDEFRRLTDRVRRLELREQGSAGTVHSFIMDPITIRHWPPALAANMTINGVLLYMESGFADVTFWVVIGGTLSELHIFSGATSGTVYSAIETQMDYGDVASLDVGDFYYPEITSGSGNNISAAFITNPGQSQ